MKTIYRQNVPAYGRVVEYHPETPEEHALLARHYRGVGDFAYICVHEPPATLPKVEPCRAR